MQTIGDKMAFWRTEGRARCCGWYKRGRGLVEASKAGATSGRALDLTFQTGPWRVVSQGVMSPTCSLARRKSCHL